MDPLARWAYGVGIPGGVPMLKSSLAIAAITCLTACQSVHSQHVDYGAGAMANGLHYAAPKAVMKVELIASGGALGLYISQPFLIGDPEATYVLNTSSSLFADNRYFFVVNPQTRLLTHVNATSDGKAGKILATLAKGIGAIKGTGKPGGNDEAYNLLLNPLANATLFSTFIYPFEYEGCDFGVACELTALDKQLHARAMVFLGCTDPANNDDNAAQCDQLGNRPDYFRISMTPLFKVTRRAVSQRDVVAPDACASSICYRAPAPYLIGVKVGDVTDESRLIMMPNKSPIMSMDLPGGVFASAKARVDLVHGMPAAVGISQDSELLEIVAIPLDIIKGFFQGVGEVFSFRIQYDNSSVALLKAEEARQKAEDAYNSGRAARLNKAEANLTTARTAYYETDAERTNAIAAAQAEAQAAAQENNAALAELGTSLSSFNSVAGANGDEAGTISDFIGQVASTTSGDTDAAEAQRSQITLLDEKQRMFEIPVIDSSAGIKERVALRNAATANAKAAAEAAAAGKNTVSTVDPNSPAGAPLVDPNAANDAH